MEKAIEHFLHEHPLILTQNVGDDVESVDCYGCGNPVSNGEWAYVCTQQKHCSNSSMHIFHKICGEFTTKIWHESHPQHPLYLVDFRKLTGHLCNLCRRSLGEELGYRCGSCDFDLDIRCKELGREGLLGDLARELQHERHIHPLKLIKKPPFLFNCDACGIEDRDMAYVCTAACELLIHKTCALLPLLLTTDHHHHQLSLSSRFPFHHRNFVYRCGVCDKDFDLACWLYYCGDCRFFAHLKCATSKQHLNKEEEEDSDLIHFPLDVHDISEKLITPFVITQNGLDKIPDANDMPQSISMPKTRASFSFLFNYHMHTLSLVSELSHQDKIKDDDDDEVKMKICDVCVTPISSPPYYECATAPATCNYFVHSVCYLLPKTLSSFDSQLYGFCFKTNKYHKFRSYTSSEIYDKASYEYLSCNFCDFYINGMFYECEDCRTKIDVKCACLPSTFKHAFHPHHKLIKTTAAEEEEREGKVKCYCCDIYLYFQSVGAYRCTNKGCDFALCFKCVMMPNSIIKQEWDKHPLLLTYDASIDHPTDFYCGFCEKQMHPKSWMYHCRPCDNSYHIHCLDRYRNIKFGREFEFDARLHPHPLTFNQITLKKRCDVCHYFNQYMVRGFECASCYYVMCRRCGAKELEKK